MKTDIFINDKQVFHISKLPNLAYRLNVKIAILTVQKEYAQEVTNFLVSSGIKAIWNFTSSTLIVPDDVLVWHEDLAASFVTFSRLISEKINLSEDKTKQIINVA